MNNHYITNINELYTDLNNLVVEAENDNYGFLKRIYNLEDQVYEVFDYGLVGYNSFMKKNALNCRGTTFNITNKDNPLLVSLAPPKFFNYEEGDIIHNKKGNIILTSMTKLDGSLISTYLHKNKVLLKSKGSLFSEQALKANKLLINSLKYQELLKEVRELANNNFTINFEYTAPDNRIVVLYPEESLTIISIRDHNNGHLYFAQEIEEKFNNYKNILKNLVLYDKVNILSENMEKYLENIREEKEGEGYVLEIFNNEKNTKYLVKAKNKAYVAKHHVKDNINSKKYLLSVVLEGASDDIKLMFTDTPEIIKEIEEFEEKVFKVYNTIKHNIEKFYDDNKALEIKDYAIKAKSLSKLEFGLVISIYKKQNYSLKDSLFKYREELFPEINFKLDPKDNKETIINLNNKNILKL